MSVLLDDGYDGDDFYCDVALPNKDKLDIVLDTEDALGYHHTKPFWETHIVVVPKQHIPSLTQTDNADERILCSLLRAVQEVARDLEAEQGAARVLTNLGDYQDSKHLHFHVFSGIRRDM